jgi:hypothetical protein
VRVLGNFGSRTPETKIRGVWADQVVHVCKPCRELNYCPYGPLVEQMPFPRTSRLEAVEHNSSLRRQLAKGAYDDRPALRPTLSPGPFPNLGGGQPRGL